MHRLKALDLSTNVGHARLTTDGGRPRLGTLVLEGPDLSYKLGQFSGWLDDQHAVDPFDALAWERPLLLPTDTVDLLELLYGLAGICYGFVGRRRMPWCEVTVQEAKAALTGNAKATKDQMLHAARRTLNWRAHTHHEADAGAVGVVAIGRIWPAQARAA